jgi:hypothetical protein
MTTSESPAWIGNLLKNLQQPRTGLVVHYFAPSNDLAASQSSLQHSFNLNSFFADNSKSQTGQPCGCSRDRLREWVV